MSIFDKKIFQRIIAFKILSITAKIYRHKNGILL